MRISILIMNTLLLPLSLHAEPFPNADAKAGKLAFDEAKCNACHAERLGGDGNRMFTRPERRIKDAPALLKQVRFCVNQTGASVFPEDFVNIAAYLNQQFYKFK